MRKWSCFALCIDSPKRAFCHDTSGCRRPRGDGPGLSAASFRYSIRPVVAACVPRQPGVEGLRRQKPRSHPASRKFSRGFSPEKRSRIASRIRPSLDRFSWAPERCRDPSRPTVLRASVARSDRRAGTLGDSFRLEPPAPHPHAAGLPGTAHPGCLDFDSAPV